MDKELQRLANFQTNFGSIWDDTSVDDASETTGNVRGDGIFNSKALKRFNKIKKKKRTPWKRTLSKNMNSPEPSRLRP